MRGPVLQINFYLPFERLKISSHTGQADSPSLSGKCNSSWTFLLNKKPCMLQAKAWRSPGRNSKSCSSILPQLGQDLKPWLQCIGYTRKSWSCRSELHVALLSIGATNLGWYDAQGVRGLQSLQMRTKLSCTGENDFPALISSNAIMNPIFGLDSFFCSLSTHENMTLRKAVRTMQISSHILSNPVSWTTFILDIPAEVEHNKLGLAGNLWYKILSSLRGLSGDWEAFLWYFQQSIAWRSKALILELSYSSQHFSVLVCLLSQRMTVLLMSYKSSGGIVITFNQVPRLSLGPCHRLYKLDHKEGCLFTSFNFQAT